MQRKTKVSGKVNFYLYIVAQGKMVDSHRVLSLTLFLKHMGKNVLFDCSLFLRRSQVYN